MAEVEPLHQRQSTEDELEVLPMEDAANEDQEKALLGKDNGGEDPQQHKSWQSPWHRVHVAILGQSNAVKATVALLLVFLAGIALWGGLLAYRRHHSLWSLPADNHVGYGRRAPEDYVLNASWNFEDQPRRREYHWLIQDLQHNPDGVYRSMLLINGQFPGPLIECNDGDTIVVHVENQGINATSIHWHGLYQNGSNWMDGTVGVTQCPIAPGQRFTYEFTVSGQWGTYWYHAHQAIQASDGLLGPFVVHSRRERELQKLSYQTDRVVMVQDHYHKPTNELLMEYLAPDAENNEPAPDGALINGGNLRNCDDFAAACDNSSVALPRFELAAGQNHRLRLINVGAFAEFSIQIDEHDFAVTEVDGTDVEPWRTRRLNINPGQRYSIILSTKVITADRFWMRAKMVTSCFRSDNPHLQAEIKAIISTERNASDVSLPASRDWDDPAEIICKDMNATDLVPVEKMATPKRPDATFFLRSNFQIGDWRLSRGFFNDSSWKPNLHSPVLQRVIDGYAARNTSFTESPGNSSGVNAQAFDLAREMVLQVPHRQTVDLIFQNFDDGNHPLHLHGHKFFVLGQGHGYFRWEMYDSLDVGNPLRRDTASLEGFGWLLIRVVADNPGVWALHCHISWHAQSGMALQLLVQPDVVGRWTLPAPNAELCKAEGLERGEGPDDGIWVGDFGSHG